MFKAQDSSYYFTIKPDRAFWYGFKPDKSSIIMSKREFGIKEEPLRDNKWLRHLAVNFPDSLRNKPNIYIVEEIDNKRYKLAHVKHFIAIE